MTFTRKLRLLYHANYNRGAVLLNVEDGLIPSKPVSAKIDHWPPLSNRVLNGAPRRMQRSATSGFMHRSKEDCFSIAAPAVALKLGLADFRR
jgi:hypothetical protein